MGEEAAAQGVGLLLGPGLNMKRSPLCGRYFEYFSEDPTLAAALGEDSGTLEDVYEPYLLMNGLINRTPRGRMATEAAYRHLGLEIE